jgi:hypothetical protein
MSRKRRVLKSDVFGTQSAAVVHNETDTGGLDLGVSNPAPIILQTNVDVKVESLPGLHLQFALMASPHLRMAARLIENTDLYLIANGLRFWTARQVDFEPCSAEIHIDDEAERVREDWRPVIGSETGLRLG